MKPENVTRHTHLFVAPAAVRDEKPELEDVRIDVCELNDGSAVLWWPNNDLSLDFPDYMTAYRTAVNIFFGFGLKPEM